MKRTFISLFAVLMMLVAVQTYAQAPQSFNYQAVARDASGNILASHTLGLKIAIHQTSSSGTIVYSETFSPTTNQFGLFTVGVGTGTVVTGTFNTIAWGADSYYLQVQMDPNGGTSYTDMGTSQLLSVPYALYAASTGSAQNLTQTLAAGNSAGTYDIDLNGKSVLNAHILGLGWSAYGGNANYIDMYYGHIFDYNGSHGQEGQILTVHGTSPNTYVTWMDPQTAVLPAGTSGQTLRHDGTSWVANSILYNDGTNVGIGSAATYNKLSVYGTDGNAAAGAHQSFITSADAYPTMQFMNWSHSSAGILFDSYLSTGNTWTSSDANANYMIYKQGSNLNFQYATGVAAGSTLSWTDLMSFTNTGNVGIGTNAPANKLEVINGASDVKFRAGSTGGYYGFGQEDGASSPAYFLGHGGAYWHFMYAATPAGAYTPKVTFDGAGNLFRPTTDNTMSLGGASYRWTAVYAVNGTIQTSDERYKTNVKDISYGLSEVLKLRPVSYNWKDKSSDVGTGTNLGFVAQEMEKIVPDVVVHSTVETDKETGKLPVEYNDVYGVKYSELIPVLVKAIQEQQAEIETLKTQIKELQK